VKSPSVPAGTAADDLGGLIEASGVGGAQFLSGLVAFLRKLFSPAHVMTVNGTVVTAESSKPAMVVEMRNKRTGETLGIETIEADNEGRLVRKIAVQVKSQALRRGSVEVPPWQKWTPEALDYHLQGVDFENEASHDLDVTAPT